MSATELGIRRNTASAGRMFEAGGVAHRWFYSILLRPHNPHRHPVKGKEGAPQGGGKDAQQRVEQ
jgi:hypothetical protein